VFHRVDRDRAVSFCRFGQRGIDYRLGLAAQRGLTLNRFDLPGVCRLPVRRIIDTASAPPRSAVRWLTVGEESAGQRLDNYLLRHLKGVPKTHVYRIIRSGQVRVNRGRAAADSRVAAGDQVRVPPLRMAASADAPSAPTAPAREFPVLFEDEHLLVIDKPAGVAVHGGSGVSFGVIEQLRRARPAARFLELAHRLDRETSGVLLIAKKTSALKDVQRQLRERQVGKTYLALVLGAWPGKLKVIDAPLARYLVVGGPGEGERRVRIARQDDPGGQRAVTLVEVLERLQGEGAETTLLAVTIKTGRTHQIRVHLASRGYPIAGDDKYGDFARNKALQKQGLRRMALHAWRLRLGHPADHQALEITAPLPSELQQFCGVWREGSGRASD
jgi:23S rRNA pseudouridine955/2504/2580 synthase